HALDLIRSGDVLMIAANGHRQTAMIGEILGGHLRRCGSAGLVCDGAIRDVATLSQWSDFPVFTRWTTPRGPASFGAGSVNAPVMIGGGQVTPGDLIMGDDDGLVALSPDLVRKHLHDARAKMGLEADWVRNLESGCTVAHTFALGPAKASMS